MVVSNLLVITLRLLNNLYQPGISCLCSSISGNGSVDQKTGNALPLNDLMKSSSYICIGSHISLSLYFSTTSSSFNLC